MRWRAASVAWGRLKQRSDSIPAATRRAWMSANGCVPPRPACASLPFPVCAGNCVCANPPPGSPSPAAPPRLRRRSWPKSPRAHAGSTKREWGACAARRFIELGATPGHVGPITVGRGWGFLHGHLHDAPLRKGDILHLDLVPRFHGYSTRVMCPIATRGVSAAKRDDDATLLALQDAQLTARRWRIAGRTAPSNGPERRGNSIGPPRTHFEE